jgi:CDP-glycerol glycerophosphotransferase (TagB/SpsB family)/glycosyltransferase involved in cell wall biosynthesis
MPKLSLIFTIAPPWETLQPALDSLRRQTLGGWEFVCVIPNNTPEDIVRRLQRFCGKRGQLVAVPADTPFTEQRNAGLAAAAGKYAAFLHSKNRFTPRFLTGLLQAAEKENAALVVGRQRSFGALGRHDFTSADALSLRRSIRCTDSRLLWNPSVSNKLYRLEDVRRLNLRFQEDFGYAADALFTLTFAFATRAAASARKGFAEWRDEPFADSAPTQAELASYISAYGQIKRHAEEYFGTEIANASGDFLRREAKRARAAYLDQVRGKLSTVLLYRFYRRFYATQPELLASAARAIFHEYDMLSDSGKSALRRAHADILHSGDLPNSPEEANETRKVTVLICGERTTDELADQLDSLSAQTMPFFELLCDERLATLFPNFWLSDPRLRFCSGQRLEGSFCLSAAEHSAAIKQAALEQAKTRYLLILERPARLDPKALQRHWHAIKKEPDAGFSTAPYSRFDGERVGSYAGAQLFFSAGKASAGRERTEQTPDYPLDLIWENKLLRRRHLQGVRFTFSADSALDCCRLYQNASFVRLRETALYLTMTQDELLAALQRDAALLPPEVRVRTRYMRLRSLRLTFRRWGAAISERVRLVSALPGEFFLRIMRGAFRRLPLRNETLFYTARPAGSYTTARLTERGTRHVRRESSDLPEDLRLLYERSNGAKRVFALELPHLLRQRAASLLRLMTARIIVTDGTAPDLADFRLRGGQRVLQIWHACGAYKRFALDAPLARPRAIEAKAHAQYTAAVVSGADCRDFAAHAFGLEPERILPLGSPHTDTLLDKDAMQARRERMLRNHPVLRGKKVYLYCPTSRAGVFDPKIRWKALSQSLEQDEIFVIHRHPLSRETYIAGRHYRRVRDYTSEPLADILSVCDVLVTDYSAVVQEAALLCKPVLFYCPDWEDYEREFYLSFPDDLPGALVTDWAELTAALRKTLAKPRLEKLAVFCKRQMGACDGRSTERVAALINSWIKE